MFFVFFSCSGAGGKEESEAGGGFRILLKIERGGSEEMCMVNLGREGVRERGRGQQIFLGVRGSQVDVPPPTPKSVDFRCEFGGRRKSLVRKPASAC